MCSTPKAPKTNSEQPKEEVIQKQANKINVMNNQSTNNTQSGLAGRDVKTAPRGLGDVANVSKKALLGE